MQERVAKLWQWGASAAFGRVLLMLVGALGFGLLEVLWRGFTHWTMLCAGAVGLLVIDYLDERAELCDWGKAALCALVITGLELIIGVAVNIYGGVGVWDYSAMPLNFLGQICALYAGIWLVLARITLPIRRRLVRWLGAL